MSDYSAAAFDMLVVDLLNMRKINDVESFISVYFPSISQQWLILDVYVSVCAGFDSSHMVDYFAA